MRDVSNLLIPSNVLTGNSSMVAGNGVSETPSYKGEGVPSEQTSVTPAHPGGVPARTGSEVMDTPGDRPSVVDGDNSPTYAYDVSSGSGWMSDAQSGIAGGSDDDWHLLP